MIACYTFLPTALTGCDDHSYLQLQRAKSKYKKITKPAIFSLNNKFLSIKIRKVQAEQTGNGKIMKDKVKEIEREDK